MPPGLGSVKSPVRKAEGLEGALTPRQQLWLALSELFLDTETRWYLPRAAWVAVEQKFDWCQVKASLDHELTPLLGENLQQVAGEWAGFDSSWLLASLRELPLGETGSGKPVLGQRTYRALHSLMDHFRSLPPQQRRGELHRLQTLVRLALEPDWARSSGFWNRLRVLSRFALEAVEETYRRGLKSSYGSLLTCPGDPSPAQLERNWSACHRVLEWLPNDPDDCDRWLQACEQLSYLFLLPGLAGLARGRQVNHELSRIALPLGAYEAVIEGPLTWLYGHSEQAWEGWRELGSR